MAPEENAQPGEREIASDASPAPGGHGIAAAQEAVDGWIGRFREGYWPPLANLARLVEEVGELSRELNHLHGPKRKREEEAESDLALEMGDVLFALIALANEQGIDLDEAFGRVLSKYRERDAERWERVP